MIFADSYTTATIKTAVVSDPKASAEVKAIEEKKIVVSEDAYLNAIMSQSLINKLDQLMVSMMVK